MPGAMAWLVLHARCDGLTRASCQVWWSDSCFMPGAMAWLVLHARCDGLTRASCQVWWSDSCFMLGVMVCLVIHARCDGLPGVMVCPVLHASVMVCLMLHAKYDGWSALSTCFSWMLICIIQNHFKVCININHWFFYNGIKKSFIFCNMKWLQKILKTMIVFAMFIHIRK